MQRNSLIGQGQFQEVGGDSWASCFAVSDLASLSVGSVGTALAQLMRAKGFDAPEAVVDRRLASLWFSWSIRAIDWDLPSLWDSIAGDYRCADGWIRLHTNAPHHRRAALSVLNCAEERKAVEDVVKDWDGAALETAVVAAGGVAAQMRSRSDWAEHPQGRAVAAEPLVHWGDPAFQPMRDWGGTATRPLAGLRVLDLTRVLAGPVASRSLAGFGADVLRVDPLDWDEPGVVPDVTLGKRCTRLDLRSDADRGAFENLLAKADVLVHGYRPDALNRLGFGPEARLNLNPALREVALCAYGWTGPWAVRRGFDSLVQMSAGIADAGQHWKGADRPVPLPVQALDHATGYLMAASLLEMLADPSGPQSARLSLARVAEELAGLPVTQTDHESLIVNDADYSPHIERTPWGQAHRLRAPLSLGQTQMVWDLPAADLGQHQPGW